MQGWQMVTHQPPRSPKDKANQCSALACQFLLEFLELQNSSLSKVLSHFHTGIWHPNDHFATGGFEEKVEWVGERTELERGRIWALIQAQQGLKQLTEQVLIVNLVIGSSDSLFQLTKEKVDHQKGRVLISMWGGSGERQRLQLCLILLHPKWANIKMNNFFSNKWQEKWQIINLSYSSNRKKIIIYWSIHLYWVIGKRLWN